MTRLVRRVKTSIRSRELAADAAKVPPLVALTDEELQDIVKAWEKKSRRWDPVAGRN